MTFLLLTLAAYRLTRIITTDTIATRPRNALAGVTSLVTCPWCTGFWVSGAVVLVSSRHVDVPLPVLTWLACASAVGFLSRLDDGA